MPRSFKHLQSAEWQVRLARLAATPVMADSEPDEAARREILRRRAQQLAKPLPSAPGQHGNGIEVLSFVAGGERHAFPAQYVAKVLAPQPITPLPRLPSYVVGIMAAEGDVLSIVDLRALLRIPITRLAEPVAVIVLRNGENEFGVLADEITGFERHDPDTIQPPEATTPDRESFLLGITSGRTGILDAARLLIDPRLTIDAG